MMGINFRILLPFLLFYNIQVSSAQTVLEIATFTTKPVEELPCQFTSSSVTVVWTEQQSGSGSIPLFSYVSATGIAKKEATDEKYNNFDIVIDQESSSLNLLITNVDEDDGGTYVCTPFSEPIVTFDVNVEVIPTEISIHCTASNGYTSSAKREVATQIVCVCMATVRSSETLKIEWEGVDAPIADKSTNVTDPSSRTITIRSETTLPPQGATSSVSCSLTGYKSQIPKSLRSYNYTFSPPVCNMVHKCLSDGMSAELTCDCTDGSPNVSAYSFYNSQMTPIGKQFYNSNTLKVDVEGKNTFYCSGHNGVKHNQNAEPVSICQQGLPWWFFLIIIGILLALLVLVIWVVKKYKQGEVGPNHRKSKNRPEKVPLRRGDVEDPQDMKHVLSKDDPPPKDKEEAKTHLLYENTPMQDQQKVQGPAGMNTVPSSGGSAPKKNDNKKTGLKNEAQAKPAGSKGAPSMPTPQTEKSKEQKDTEKTGLKNEAQAKPAASKGAPSIPTPRTEKPKKQKDSEKEGADRDVSKKDPPKEKTGAKVDPSTNLASKSEVSKKELSKKKEEERLETGGSGLETKDNRNTEHSEQAIPLSPRTPGDGEPDHAPGIKESANSPGPISDGLESSVDLVSPEDNPAGQQESHDKNGAPQNDGSSKSITRQANPQSNADFQLALANAH